MCSTSAISDHYMNPQWPYRQHLGPIQPTFPQIVQQDPELKEMLRKTIQLLDKIDKRLGERDCKDEAKAAFYKALDLDPPGGRLDE